MMTIKLICIGKLKEDYLKGAQAEYQKRLSAFCKLSIIELAEYKLPQNPADSLIQKGMQAEGEDILSKAKGYIASLCIEGDMLSSVELSKKLDEIALDGQSEVSLIIGGSNGLSDEVKNSSKLKLSMSKMTFPHQLARVMLLEQLYRAFQINGGGKYHK